MPGAVRENDEGILMDSRNATRVLVRALRTLSVLALPPDAQVACLGQMGVAPLADELALGFHDQVLLLDGLVSDGYLDAADADGLRAIDAQLEAMSGDATRCMPIYT